MNRDPFYKTTSVLLAGAAGGGGEGPQKGRSVRILKLTSQKKHPQHLG